MDGYERRGPGCGDSTPPLCVVRPSVSLHTSVIGTSSNDHFKDMTIHSARCPAFDIEARIEAMPMGETDRLAWQPGSAVYRHDIYCRRLLQPSVVVSLLTMIQMVTAKPRPSLMIWNHSALAA